MNDIERYRKMRQLSGIMGRAGGNAYATTAFWIRDTHTRLWRLLGADDADEWLDFLLEDRRAS